MKYWQHDETGRVCVSLYRPSERWFEITEAQYLSHTADAPKPDPRPTPSKPGKELK